jgi:AcrR family transcriptional regulator
MCPRAVTTAIPETRELIIDAANARFLHYGVNKTTMAEIADDVGMSAANLYRYFANKQDIAVECARRCMVERVDRVGRVVSDRSRSPTEKLHGVATTMIEHTHELAEPGSKMGSLVATVTRERPDLVHDQIAKLEEAIARILRDGVAAGVFRIGDSRAAARSVYGALAIFDVPMFVGLFSREEFETRAHAVVTLIIDGLRNLPPDRSQP